MATGFLISPRVVITAGYAVHDGSELADSVEVHPGRNGNSQLVSPITVNRTGLHTTVAWRDEQDLNECLGAILLPEALTGCQPLDFEPLSDDELMSQIVNLVGYPGEKPFTLWGSNGEVTDVRAKSIRYLLDTTPGQSGSPVFIQHDSARATVVGVHVGGSPKQAVRISESVANTIRGCI